MAQEFYLKLPLKVLINITPLIQCSYTLSRPSPLKNIRDMGKGHSKKTHLLGCLGRRRKQNGREGSGGCDVVSVELSVNPMGSSEAGVAPTSADY